MNMGWIIAMPHECQAAFLRHSMPFHHFCLASSLGTNHGYINDWLSAPDEISCTQGKEVIWSTGWIVDIIKVSCAPMALMLVIKWGCRRER